MNIINKIKQKSPTNLNNFILDKSSKRFVEHNRKIWGNFKQKGKNTPEILFELNGMSSAIIAYSYLANVLSEKYQARIIAFSETKLKGWKGIFKKIFEDSNKKIYRSFGVSEFMNVSLNKKQKNEAFLLFNKVYPELKTKSDVEQLNVKGVLIGDLVYDTYLRNENVPTINLREVSFIDSLKNSIEYFVFWQDYFESHNVKAINISHCVYNLAIPLRVAVSKEIPVYQINATHAYRLSKDNLHAYNDFKYFPEYFRNLPKDVQGTGLQEGKVRLKRRFAGEVGVDMAYSTKSAYTDEVKKAVLNKSKKIKILIATHCFFDSPHPYGNNLFPDFYEWLSFLGKVSEETDYDWYIKTHPDFLPGNKEIIEYFLNMYPRFTLIPADTSHKQIIKEGINYALTVYGTIGFEYAALGVPVINASLCNPHIAYDFNFHPGSISEYYDLLINLGRQELSIDLNEVYEYYYMKNIHNTEDWLFNSYSELILNLGDRRKQFESPVYDYFLDEFTEEKHNKIIKTLNNFVGSGDFRLSHTHIMKN